MRLAFGYSREVGKMFKKNGTCMEVNMCQQHTERHTNKPLPRVFRDLRTHSPSIFAQQEQARLKMYRMILQKSRYHVL